MLIHGARSALLQAKRIAKRKPDTLTRLQRWALDLEQRVGHNKATVALANKIARIAWAIWHHDRPFHGSFAAAWHPPLHRLRRDRRRHDETGRHRHGIKPATKAQERFGASVANSEGTRPRTGRATNPSPRARCNDWLPVCGLHDGQMPLASHQKAGYTTATPVLSRLQLTALPGESIYDLLGGTSMVVQAY